MPISTAPRFATPVPLPDRESVPLFVIALEESTVNGVGVPGNEKLPVAVESMLMVTLVLPVAATTDEMPVPEQVTVVLLPGAVAEQAASAPTGIAPVKIAIPPKPRLHTFLCIISPALNERCRCRPMRGFVYIIYLQNINKTGRTGFHKECE